jgi:hypothetical protein
VSKYDLKVPSQRRVFKGLGEDEEDVRGEREIWNPLKISWRGWVWRETAGDTANTMIFWS